MAANTPIAPTPKKIAGLRWYIVALLCFASELNYLDRQTLSVLAQTIQDELGISTMQYANITSAFLVSYTIMYAVSGRLVDILGTRRSFMVFVTGWSIANMLHGFARTANHFIFFRFLLGATEPANFPAGVKASTEWFPMRQRALAVGIFNAGTTIGSAMAAPFVTFIALTWGWRYAFVAGGALGLIWVAVWAVAYRLPREHPRLSAEELALIEGGRPANEIDPPRVPIMRLLKMRETWGCILARALTDPISYFFFFWTPKFLQSERGFTLAEIGKYSWIPFVAGAVGNVMGGAIPTALTSRGWTLDRARKTTMLVASCCMPLWCYLIVQVPNPALALVFASAAMFCHTLWANITLPAEKFPAHVVGTISGFGGCLGGAMGVLTQQGIGWTVQNVSFTPVFAVCAFVHLTAFVGVSYLVGELGKVRDVSAA
ncbi:MAG TPA: MFS transporter [Opitutaceae bacterium]|nr:MFS transporter [Opitutaceae bacterium]